MPSTTKSIDDRRSSEDIGQRATVPYRLQQLTSEGAKHSEPALRVPSCLADPEKFGCKNIQKVFVSYMDTNERPDKYKREQQKLLGNIIIIL